MIVGIGVDLVDVARFERSIERTPRLRERLFTASERTRTPRSLAARYAAKEALIKALGGSDGVHWSEIEVTSEASGRPWFALTGSTAAVVLERGITTLHLSMSHDAGLAIAYVMAESDAGSDAVADAGVDAGSDAVADAGSASARPAAERATYARGDAVRSTGARALAGSAGGGAPGGEQAEAGLDDERRGELR